jgi:N-acetylmuramoyl-L-alanine amidase
VNAYGSDGKWHEPNGWSVRVGTKASARSKQLADCLFDAAKSYGLKMRQPSPKQKYWEQSLYVLNRTHCPAVLTENLFMDNKKDAEWLLSDEGKHEIERLHLEGILEYIKEINTMELLDNV